MWSVEVRVPQQSDLSRAVQLVEDLCASEGLSVTMRGSLKKYPTSLHWHFKKGRDKGTLEITFWRKAGRLWFSVDRGRTAGWIAGSVQRLRVKLEQELVPQGRAGTR